jgi:DNA repair protein RecN (Recombination protein N)
VLAALRIQNLAVIDEVEVRFRAGLNVLTGETGAGKSILVDSLHLALGSRAETDVIRTGAEEAVVEALFEGVDFSDRLASLGLPIRGQELLVRRIVARNGRGRAYVNGGLATVTMLEQATRGLAEISGQHEHLSLLDVECQLDLLDSYIGLAKEIASYREAFDALGSAARELEALKTDDAERARRADYLAFQVDEIDRVAPKPGEEKELAALKLRLGSAEKLRAAAVSAEQSIYSAEGAAVESIGAATQRLTEAAVLDPRLDPTLQSLKGALVELEEAARELGRYASSLDADPARLAEVDERIEALKRLARKHGGDLDAVLGRRDAMRAELDGIARHGERLAELAQQVQQRQTRAKELATALTTKRHEGARDLAKLIRSELARLVMANTDLEVRLSRLPELGPKGEDAVDMLISPNAGEELRPLARIASGGELSRIMLAIKRTLARADPVPTHVFDEVDSGIGGAVAEVVGRMLHDASEGRQVLCVTHLPQIAAFADHHYVVRKSRRAGRSVSTVAEVGGDDRTREIARMVAGVEVNPAATAHAEEMIAAARRRLRGP